MKMKCLAKGENNTTPLVSEPATLLSRVWHSTNWANSAPPKTNDYFYKVFMCKTFHKLHFNWTFTHHILVRKGLIWLGPTVSLQKLQKSQLESRSYTKIWRIKTCLLFPIEVIYFYLLKWVNNSYLPILFLQSCWLVGFLYATGPTLPKWKSSFPGSTRAVNTWLSIQKNHPSRF